MKTRHHSVAASILSLPITIAGFSKLQLTAWWHFAVMALIIPLLYFVLLLILDTGTDLYEKCLKRANIAASEEVELQQLNDYINEILCKYNQYRQTEIECIKKLLRQNISALYEGACGKISFIERTIESPTLKYKFSITKEEIDVYKNFCAYIKDEYKL